MTRNMHDRRFWELCYCLRCGRLNYVEPYRKTAKCACSPRKTQHKVIPAKYQNATGTIYNGPPRIENNRGKGRGINRVSAGDEHNSGQNPAQSTMMRIRATTVTELDSEPYLTC